jgi:hypothetical protein
MERKPQLSQAEIQQATQFGGSDWQEYQEYLKEQELNYCDKGGHKERSIANQPNHLKFWKKSGDR